MHRPVLLEEVITHLDPRPGRFIIDGTIDGGGHARAILSKVLPGGMVLGVDWDGDMVASWQAHLPEGMRVVRGNYADIPDILRSEQLPLADGLLLDLGFSSEQIDASGRGFSFRDEAGDEPLLMIYDDGRDPVSVVLRSIGEEALANLIYEFGGERYSRRIAKAIKDRGRRRPIATSGDLAAVIRGAVPRSYERGRIDPATRTFQALRIYANDEIGNLRNILGRLDGAVKPGGRVAIITFHSLEDRIVKQAFRALEREGRGEALTPKPVAASRVEIAENPRARSAKLRVIALSH